MSKKPNVTVVDKGLLDFQQQMMEAYGVKATKANRQAEWMLVALILLVTAIVMTLIIVGMAAAIRPDLLW